ncbi:metalloregulator ArsR/SmtB family transcription factor [Chitinophaga sp. SYP-B3965]|uniref:ArsR/SmtB family transcription factor n=1 Tax=Chitinophaga sp. SYP-B3965 TaxID=2663120 RepID=UPI001299AAB6|nr:metalloregulator ArsR/SmtB family transcription factor [Chitinophaga sp. SYP-B3965]MRG44146.1 metalloregulator ArsR/SmtB family transcription factor [Chitinophaga sp. SYP-B3965]
MEKRRDVFQAIADPTRREIIQLLSRESLNFNSIADHFDATRPTISQHIMILEECGLLIIKKQGREKFCEAKLDKLEEVSTWVQQYSKAWNETIDAMENFLKNKKNGKQK